MSDTGPPALDAVAILEVLERHQVQYVVIGGYAAELHGSARHTVDVDVVPATTQENWSGSLSRCGTWMRASGRRPSPPACRSRPPPRRCRA